MSKDPVVETKANLGQIKLLSWIMLGLSVSFSILSIANILSGQKEDIGTTANLLLFSILISFALAASLMVIQKEFKKIHTKLDALQTKT